MNDEDQAVRHDGTHTPMPDDCDDCADAALRVYRVYNGLEADALIYRLVRASSGDDAIRRVQASGFTGPCMRFEQVTFGGDGVEVLGTPAHDRSRR